MTVQARKADAFFELHQREGVFLIPNPWDIGSARLLEAQGFDALATTSSGFAQTLGRVDGAVSADEMFEHCSKLCAATRIPISADLENCFGDNPESVAACITRFAESGIVGASVEDFSGDLRNPIYEFHLAVDRVQAAAEAASKLDFKFMLTARAENLLRVDRDIDETIKRLRAFEAVGADVIYAPALRSLDEVRRIAEATTKPQNVLGPPLQECTVNQIGKAGAKRISTGGALARLAASATLRAAALMHDQGSLKWVGDVDSVSDLERAFAPEVD